MSLPSKIPSPAPISRSLGAHPARALRTYLPVHVLTFVLLVLVSIVAAWAHNARADGVTHDVIFLPSKIAIKAEVADTDASRARGLMYRTRLGAKEGMIFYFSQTGYHAFYMYNTRIPLTVIFLNESLKIVDIRDMAPCAEKDPVACPVYSPKAACKYAIEVNQEFVPKYGIRVGNLVKIKE